MALQAMALGVTNPQNNALGAFSDGVNARQSFDSNNITLAKQGIETVGSIALGAMGGKLDGEADPALFEKGLDMLAAQGINVEQFRGRPDVAPMVARASMTALQQLQAAQDERQYNLAMEKFQKDIADAATPKTSLNLSYGTNAAGDVVPLQTTDNGTMVQPTMPEGVSLATKSDKIDLGTEWGILDPLTRQVVARVPKDNFGEARDTAAGTVAGKSSQERIEELPKAEATADNMVATIDSVLDDPALDSSTGWLAWMQGVPGTDQYRFGTKALQLQGQAFLQAFQTLKGGGAITETEGTKAEQAIGRLSTSQSPEDYRAALTDLKGLITEAKARAQSNAGSDPNAADAPRLAVPEYGEGTVIQNDAGEQMVMRNGKWESM